MTAAETLAFGRDRVGPVAPWRHTFVLVAIFLALALGGALLQSRAASQGGELAARQSLLPLYLSLIAAQWGLFYYVWKGGLRRAGVPVREIVGGRWAGPRDLLLDLSLAAGLWAGWMLTQIVWGKLVAPGRAASVRTLLPRRPSEIALWVALSASAGFCEEFVFRGYFLRQFRALTGRAWLALVMQAALFGVSHGYQGVQACLKITLFGVLFGLAALWRRSIRPCAAAHALADIVAGLA